MVLGKGRKHSTCRMLPHTAAAGKHGLCLAGSCTKTAIGHDGKGLSVRQRPIPTKALFGASDARSMCVLA